MKIVSSVLFFLAALSKLSAQPEYSVANDGEIYFLGGTLTAEVTYNCHPYYAPSTVTTAIGNVTFWLGLTPATSANGGGLLDTSSLPGFINIVTINSWETSFNQPDFWVESITMPAVIVITVTDAPQPPPPDEPTAMPSDGIRRAAPVCLFGGCPSLIFHFG
jgi:hypothetical protein